MKRFLFVLAVVWVWVGVVSLSRAEWILQTEAGTVPLTVRSNLTVLSEPVAVSPGKADVRLKTGDAVRPAMKVMSLPAVDPDGDLIGSLARQLEYDWERIYWYVSNRIKTEPYVGLIRSPERTLLDGAGSPIEQAYLFSELMRRTGRETCFWDVELPIPVQSDADIDICDLTGIANYSDAFDLLAGGGMVLSSPLPLLPTSQVGIYGVLTGVEIDGVLLYLAPWYKSHAPAGMVDFKQAMGYAKTNFLNAAGGSSGAGWVSGLTNGAVTTLLNQYAGNLQGSFRTNGVSTDGAHPVSQVIPSDAVMGLSGYSWYPVTNAWDLQPTYTAQLIFSSSNFPPQTLSTYETAHKKISIRFETNGTHRAKLYVDGTTKTNWMEGGAGGTNGAPFQLTVAVTNAGAAADTETYSLKRGSQYVFCQSFGTGCSSDMSGYISKNITALKREGATDDSPDVFTESLRYTGQRWMDQTSAATETLPVLTGMKHISKYQFGIMAGETSGFYIDVKQMLKFGNVFTNRFSFANLYLGSALEHAVLEQLQPGNAQGTSTIRVLEKANANNMKIYRADSNNWNSIKSSLSGYDQTSIQSNINKGAVYILPQTNSVTIAQWTGGGHVMYFRDALLRMAVGLYDGGVNALKTAYQPAIQQVNTVPVYIAPVTIKPITLSKDPVDMQTGAFLFNHTDLELTGPLPLTLHRSYRSDASENTSQGFGWMHSLNIRAVEHSAIDQGFGQRSAEDMAAYLVGASVVQDLLDNESTAKDWVTAALVADWTVGQLTQNAVSIYLGSKVLTFVKQPDGSYTPPPGMTVSLTLTNGVYVMQERNANTYTFNTNKFLTQIRDPDSNTLTFAYNAQTNLQSVASSFGPSFTFSYNASNLLSSVADNSTPARTIQYQYGAKNNLTNFVDAAGKNWGIAYSNTNYPNAITSLTDPEGIVTIQNFYNSFGQVTNQVSATEQNYDLFITDYRSVESDPLGHRTTYEYDSKGRTVVSWKPDGTKQSNLYDGWDRVTNTVNEAGVANVFVYDINQNLLEKREAVGTEKERVVYYSYDANNRQTCVSNQVSGSTFQISHFEYDTKHHLTKITDALGNETTFEYWSNGQLKKKTEDGGRVTEYAYDGNGNPDTIASTDAGTVNLDYNARGELVQKTDGRGQATAYTYDPRGLLLKTVYPDGSSVSNSYNGAGLLIAQKDARSNTVSTTYTPAYKVKTVATPDGGTVSNSYDEADRLIAVKNAKNETTRYSLDAIGRVNSVYSDYFTVMKYYDPVGNLTDSGVEFWNFADESFFLWTHTEYDVFNQPVSVQSPALSTVQYQYDLLGRQTNRIDAASKSWKSGYDALGRKTATIRPSGATEQFVYDALGNRIGFYNAEGKPITFGFDAQGRVTAITNAIGKVTRFVYDVNGNMTSRTDAKNAETVYSYNSMNRLTNVVYEGQWKASFAYDANGNNVEQSSPLASVSSGYDSMNRLSSSLISVNSRSFAVTNSYDLNGNRTNIVYPGGLNVGYSYDAENRLVGVTTKYTNHTESFSFGYDRASRLTDMAYPNGVNSAFGYDAESRVTNYTHGTFLNHAITRDPRGHKTQEDIYAGLVPNFTNGLRQTRTHNDADQLLSAGANEYSYDPNGNLTNSASGVYQWNYDNRLVNAGGTEYLYDGSGARIGRIANGVTNYFILDYKTPLKMPLAEADALGNITRYYVWGTHGLLCHLDMNPTNGAVVVTRYYHTDEQGSTLALTDESGAATDQFAYSPYGQVLGHTGTNSTPYLWLGGYGVYYDSNVNLHLTLHRAYSAEQKRFIACDPLGINGGPNLYAYGNLNPLAFVDPYGLEAIINDLTLGEANRHFREGGGDPITVNASSIRITGVNTSDFSDVGDKELYRTKILSAGGDFFVYGTVTLEYAGNNRVNILPDIYDFDIQSGRPFRNIETRIGHSVAGEGTPYRIYFEGSVPIKP